MGINLNFHYAADVWRDMRESPYMYIYEIYEIYNEKGRNGRVMKVPRKE